MVAIEEILDFGEGKDKLTIGKNAKLGVNTLDNLEVLSMSSGAELWIADEASYTAAKIAFGGKYGDDKIINGKLA